MTDTDNLRDKDQIVLQSISNGHDDIQKITETTILENHEVNYCFSKLEDLNLIHVEKPDGYTTRLVNGQKRTFQTPKNAQITSQGLQALKENHQEEKLDQYENLSHRELVEKTRQHEAEIQRLKNQIANFRKQVRKHLME